MTLGNGQMLPEFDDALLNVKANEDKEIQLTFPDNYHKEELAKKKAVFSVSVKEVKALEVAELTRHLFAHLELKVGMQKT